MLNPTTRLAAFTEGALGTTNAKMTEGMLRYGRNPVVAIIDRAGAGRTAGDFFDVGHDIPVVPDLEAAVALGAEALVLGTAPSGGRIPQEWMPVLRDAVARGLHIINGLHDPLNPVLGPDLRPGQWIWDIRTPVGDMPPIAMGRAASLGNTRVLMVGTDMAIGKMTTGLEIDRALRAAGQDSIFLATGQTGISIMGTGIPLDAFRVDHACGAVERMVLQAGHHAIQIIEGQGSLLHPGSTATLPLMRGSCANRLILCHKAGMRHLDTSGEVRVPPLRDVIALNEAVAGAAGALTPARVVGIALNTRELDRDAAGREIARVADETGLPVTDPVRNGAGVLSEAIVAARV